MIDSGPDCAAGVLGVLFLLVFIALISLIAFVSFATFVRLARRSCCWLGRCLLRCGGNISRYWRSPHHLLNHFFTTYGHCNDDRILFAL